MRRTVRRLAPLIVVAAFALSLFTASLASAAPVPIKLRIENAFEVSHFLKLTKAKHSTNAVVVTDGLTGEPIENATVGPVNNGPGVTTNAEGEATLSFSTVGKHRLKAKRSDSIRSNSLVMKTS